MKTSVQFPPCPHWTVQDLADAIPVRLSQMLVFTTAAGAGGENENHFNAQPKRELRGRYLARCTTLRLFRVQG